MCSISRTLNLAETTVAKILKEACVIIRPRGVKPGTPSKYNQMLLDPQYFHAAKLDYDFMIAAAVMNEEPKLRSPKAFTRFKRLKVEMAHA